MISAIDLIFLIGLAFLATHELDAILHHEWRYFFFLRPFDDVTAYRIFTFVHVPLFVWMFSSWGARPFQIGFDMFIIFHAGLHFALRNHPLIVGFNNPFSRLLIYGGVPFAALHLILLQSL
jgi:hypothetical protein